MLAAIMLALKGRQGFLLLYGTAVAAMFFVWTTILVTHIGFRRTLSPERLNTVLTLRRRGRTATLPPWAMLRHIVNHSTYHRAQVAAKLKRFGIEQPTTDFFFWVIEQIPQEA